MMRLIKKLGYKTVTEFYQDIADEKLDANNILDKYVEMKKKETEAQQDITYRSAETYSNSNSCRMTKRSKMTYW